MIDFIKKNKKLIINGIIMYYYPPTLTYIIIKGIKYYLKI